MTSRFNKELRDKMKMAYFQGRTDVYVARTLNVTIPSVAKYRKLDNWDEWCGKMDMALDQRMLKKAVAAREDSLRMLRTAKGMIAKDLKKKLDAGESIEFAARDFSELVKLEELLMGSATERTDHTFSSREEVQAFVDGLPRADRERLAHNGSTLADSGGDSEDND